jgi:ribosomal protein S6
MIEMGKKQLAYPINKVNEANYLFWTLELEPKSVTLIDRKLTNDSTILRHLVVKI